MTMDEDFDPAARELCPDGACVGLIGPDGRCKVCGAVGAGIQRDPRNQSLVPVEEIAVVAAEAGTDADPDADDDLATRELCPDGACIGVIGPGGRCKVCGTPADSRA